MPFPPSPALSVCDSLAGIDDLDAYLDAQPALSHFPTPPLNDGPSKYTHFVECFDDIDGIEYSNIAEVLVGRADADVDAADVDVVHSVLRHTQLPPEVLAVASNILSALGVVRVGPQQPSSAPLRVPGFRTMVETQTRERPCRALAVIASLNLALSYSSDHAPNAAWWAKHCQGRWTTTDIDQAALCIYAALGWNLHRFTDQAEVDRALDSLSNVRRDSRVDAVDSTSDPAPMPALMSSISLAG